MSTLDDMKNDTTDILDEWGETLTVKRTATSYDDKGKATITWTTIGTISGDWQPAGGSTVIAEEGLEIKSDALVIAAFDDDVEEGDRIYRANGTYEYVNYVKKFEDHITVYLTKTEGE